MTARPDRTTGVMRLVPMQPRDPAEPGRAASTLELFFDLVFVVAVSRAAVELHHALTEGHVGGGLGSYVIVFFGIWWAWMNFTWFATSFDTDDWLYRVTTIVQMAGVLILAAGIERAFHHDLTVTLAGYIVMRVAMVSQWIRAALASTGASRQAATIYAIGVAVVQVGWLGVILIHGTAGTVLTVLLILAEIAVPVVAERSGSTPWHPHHITERYGLFTLILLGESLLASANAVIEAMHEHESLGPLLSISALTLVVTACLWWFYFWPPHHSQITTFASSLRYGYVHYVVFAAAGALSAGVEVQIDAATHHTALGEIAAGLTFSVPAALFVLSIWWIAVRDNAEAVVNVATLVAAVFVLVAPLTHLPIAVVGLVMVALVVVLVRHPPLAQRSETSPGRNG